MATSAARIAQFRKLHESGCFVIPNPWDLGTARVLEQLGFSALATTSSGFAWSQGRSDADSSVTAVLAHVKALVSGVSVPVSADFQDGFATTPEEVAQHVRALMSTGVAGFSIEDSTRSSSAPLYDFSLAVERVSAAAEAVRVSESQPVLTARTEGFLVGRAELDETLRRLLAFADAGADCLYAPGLRNIDEIATVVNAVAPKPVNVLVGSDFTTVADLAAVGVRRISVGGALARVAWNAFLEAAEEIVGAGSFTQLAHGVLFSALDNRFRR